MLSAYNVDIEDCFFFSSAIPTMKNGEFMRKVLSMQEDFYVCWLRFGYTRKDQHLKFIYIDLSNVYVNQ